MLNRRGKVFSAGKMTIRYRASRQRKSRNKVIDTYQLREREETRLRTRSIERGIAWILTIVVVDDTLGYHTREVVGGYGDGSSACTVSGTPYANGFNVAANDWGILGWSTTWTEVASATATGTALLSSRISSRRGHRYLWMFGEGMEGLGI